MISHKNIIYWLVIWIFSFLIGYLWEKFHFLPDTEKEYYFSWAVYDSKKTKEVYSFIEKYYYWFQKKDYKKMEDDYLSAMTMALWDKHTNYFNWVDSQKFTDSLAWDFQWIGAVIQDHKKWILIVKIIDKSPAQKNNLIAWDIITHVNGDSMLGVPSSEAVNKIRGPKWTTVILSIITVKDEQKKEVTIKRDTVIVPSVESRVLTWGKIWYIWISVFGETTAIDIEAALKNLTQSWVQAIVVDARSNGWWYLESAVDILSLFLGKNKIAVTTKWNNPEDNQKFYTKNLAFSFPKIPVVMLVNSMSASATEILAWALQDYDRAIIIGETSYGKWSVQTPFLLSDWSLVKVTTAKWYTPKDRWIDEKWIIPDIEIHFRDEDFKSAYDRQLEWAVSVITLMLDSKKTFTEWKDEAVKLTF
jgi:carboxyl-terminal processing protease